MSTANELRAAARKLRVCPIPLSDFIPLLQKAADELESSDDRATPGEADYCPSCKLPRIIYGCTDACQHE